MCDMYPLDSQRHVVHPSLIMTDLQGVGHHFHGAGTGEGQREGEV